MKKAPRSIHVTYLRHTPKLPVVGDKGALSALIIQFKLLQNVEVQRNIRQANQGLKPLRKPEGGSTVPRIYTEFHGVKPLRETPLLCETPCHPVIRRLFNMISQKKTRRGKHLARLRTVILLFYSAAFSATTATTFFLTPLRRFLP
jgi:hypothetical protein